jgi:hypothetical protein
MGETRHFRSAFEHNLKPKRDSTRRLQSRKIFEGVGYVLQARSFAECTKVIAELEHEVRPQNHEAKRWLVARSG